MFFDFFERSKFIGVLFVKRGNKFGDVKIGCVKPGIFFGCSFISHSFYTVLELAASMKVEFLVVNLRDFVFEVTVNLNQRWR